MLAHISTLGRMLFNIYFNDIFFTLNETDICNFVNDTAPCVCDSDLKSVLETFKHKPELVSLGLRWII